jgi:hypothetical protein
MLILPGLTMVSSALAGSILPPETAAVLSQSNIGFRVVFVLGRGAISYTGRLFSKTILCPSGGAGQPFISLRVYQLNL